MNCHLSNRSVVIFIHYKRTVTIILPKACDTYLRFTDWTSGHRGDQSLPDVTQPVPSRAENRISICRDSNLQWFTEMISKNRMKCHHKKLEEPEMILLDKLNTERGSRLWTVKAFVLRPKKKEKKNLVTE